MANISAVRVQREFSDVLTCEEVKSGEIKLEMVDDSYNDLIGEILGPIDTPYEGGRFKLEIKIPEEYPFHPPQIRFLTYIWHPNISSASGHICLNSITEQWGAALTLKTLLISIQALLSFMEPESPQDAMVALQYKKNKAMFDLTAKHWTNVYAGGPHEVPEYDAKVQHLMQIGLGSHNCRLMLSLHKWDPMLASEHYYF